jgi:chromosome segregation ATPase
MSRSPGLSLLMLCLLAPLGARGQTATPPAEALRIPGIHKLWGKPEDMPKAEATIEDLERCAGEDLALRQQLASLKTRRAELDAQRQGFAADEDAVQRSGKALDTARQALNDQTSAYERSQQDKARRRAELGPLTSRPASSPEEARRVQDLVQRFNNDLRAMDGRRQALLAQQKSFNQQVGTHNALVNALQERTTPWDTRRQAWITDMKATNERAASMHAQCAGERLLVKPDPNPDVLTPR